MRSERLAQADAEAWFAIMAPRARRLARAAKPGRDRQKRGEKKPDSLEAQWIAPGRTDRDHNLLSRDDEAPRVR
jgi:hypothetical protein